MNKCLSCAIVDKKVKNIESIIVTKYFNAHQDYETPIPGFIIITSKRHIQGIDELTKKEQTEFIYLTCGLRKILKDVGIRHSIIIQNEITRHHFHCWIFPWLTWMEKKFNTELELIHSIMKFSREQRSTARHLKILSNQNLIISQKANAYFKILK